MTHPLTPREKVADRGPAGAVMDALWPILGGDQMDAETWTEISMAVGTALASGSGDHAELARLAEAAQKAPSEWGCSTKEGAAFIAAANPATVLTLLAEIAALRAERDQIRSLHNRATDRSRHWEIAALRSDARATEAKRKLAEVVGLLEPFAREADSWPELADGDTLALTAPDGTASAFDITMGHIRAARAFLSSKEAERG